LSFVVGSFVEDLGRVGGELDNLLAVGVVEELERMGSQFDYSLGGFVETLGSGG